MVKKRNVGKKTLIKSKNRVAEEKCKSAIRDKGEEIERSSFVEYGGRFLDENIFLETFSKIWVSCVFIFKVKTLE